MKTGRLVAAWLAVPVLVMVAGAQAPSALPVLDDKPTPQPDALGPSAPVTSLAFGPDDETLYAASLDKVVRLWTVDKGNFVLKMTYRVPIGPGNMGALNAVALSPDGKWLAMAGRAPMRGEAGFRQSGVIIDTAALSPEQHLDAGVIYVASAAHPAGGKVLRGHRGEVRALAFAPAYQGKPPLLVSAAFERDGTRRFGGLRLWNAESGTLLAERTDLPANKARTGLAIWHTGPGAGQLRVALAWPDEADPKQSYLRLWDTGPGAVPRQRWQADRATQTVALLGQDDGARLVTAGYGPQNAGRLLLWHLSADRQARASLDAEVLFPRRAQVPLLPVSLCLVNAGDGAPGHAAVVLLPLGGASPAGSDYRLALVDLRTRRIVADLPLADSDTNHLPAVAARGRYLAVAAMRDHAVRVYAVADLLAGKVEPKAVLASDGLALRRVAFVDKGRGLWLSADQAAGSLSGGLVFDLDQRRVRANQQTALVLDAPALGEWSLVQDRDRKTVHVRQGSRRLPSVRLRGADEEVTAAALRPPAPGRPAVLAVAYTERAAERTLIMLCDPAEGKPYRLLDGHLQRVNQLALSASRPLLASVAEDQTVCVWSLADLDHAVGQVPGLAVSQDKGKPVVVRSVEAASPAAKAGLAAGDVLETVAAPAGKARPVQQATDLLRTIAARSPGDWVEVGVAGKGVIKLPVARGVDERKPLFALLLLRRPGLPEWVGWSPAGPYDYSSPAAETHLGWHRNTGDPAAPVSYAGAGAYRKDYYRQGILGYLAAEADLGRALQKWQEDHPARLPPATLWFLRPEGALPTVRADEYLVRQALPAVAIGINQDYALDEQHVLRWRLTRSDGGTVAPDAAVIAGEARRDGKQWQAELSGVAWRRGEYRMWVELHARSDGPVLATETVTLRFQPPAPVLALRLQNKELVTTEQQPLQVKQEKLALQIGLQAAVGQEVEIQFAQSRNGLPQQEAPAARLQVGPATFLQEFRLQEGLNHLKVQALNKGALTGHEHAEAAVADVWVSYQAPPELPPRVTVLRLEPEPDVTRQDGKEVWVVNQPEVRLLGKIESTGILVKADWSAGGAPQPLPLPRRGRVLEFTAALKLKAGEPVPLRLRAKSTHSDEKLAERWVVFWPPLPNLTADPLDNQDIFTDKITLTGRLQAATTDPFNLLFRVASAEGKVQSFQAELDAKAGKWRVELALFPGVNRIEAFVANRWRRGRAFDGAWKLHYRRPPHITAFPKAVDAVETNKVRVAVTVEGPANRPLRAMKVERQAIRFEAGTVETQGDRWIWKTVELPEVFVHDGDRNLDTLSIQAVTDEGESQAVVVRVFHKRLPRLPRARFLSPLAADTAGRPEYPVVFRVESERPLERVEIRGGSAVYRADLQNVEREGERYVLQGKALITLTAGPNTLELVAVNAEGRSPRAEVVVSYTEPAVLVRIDRVQKLEADNAGGQEVLKPVYLANGDVTFAQAAPWGLVWLVGHVRWSDPKAKALDDRDLEVVAKVEDCRQFPVRLERRGTGENAAIRSFRMPLVLIRAENRIRIEVPSLGQQDRSHSGFQLPCTAPALKQRLHLLIVAVAVKDAELLKKRVLDALAADPRDRPRKGEAQGEFKKPLFEQCYLYHVLIGEVLPGNVEAQLVEINRAIKRLQRVSGWLNDLVLIYYQGEDVEVPGKNDRLLKTSLNYQFPKTPPERFAISCHALPRIPGVQLLLLNVPWTPDARSAERDGGGAPDTGLLRYACHDSAEVRTADPALLHLLEEAIRKKGRLGEIVDYVNELLGRQPVKFSRLVVIDEYQARRRISGQNPDQAGSSGP